VLKSNGWKISEDIIGLDKMPNQVCNDDQETAHYKKYQNPGHGKTLHMLGMDKFKFHSLISHPDCIGKMEQNKYKSTIQRKIQSNKLE